MKYKKMGIVMVIVSTVFGMPVMGDEADYLYVTGTNIPDCSMGIVSLEDVLKWDQSEDWKTYFAIGSVCQCQWRWSISDFMSGHGKCQLSAGNRRGSTVYRRKK